MNGIHDSEKKRLQSLKQKKEKFRANELIVQNALKNLDNKTNKNKIVFDEDIDKVIEPKIKTKIGKRKYDLFDGDDDNNESLWDDNTFKITKKPGGQSIILGNDKRFKLDERFMEDDSILDENIMTENNSNNESELQKEKEWQLDILENILGVPIQTTSKNKKTTKDSKFARKQMIRYDPTEINHKEYEIIAEKPQIDTKNVKKKKKLKHIIEDNVENSVTEVSKDVYFSVSESLSKSFKEGGQFSLLKTYKKDEINEKRDHEYNASTIDSSKHTKFHFNLETKNPFKYDSSDNENDNEEIEPKNEQHTNHLVKVTNRFFFDINDIRFNEAVNFFSKESVPDNDLKDLRPQLKQIMRSKIRRNIRKIQPHGRKRKIKH